MYRDRIRVRSAGNSGPYLGSLAPSSSSRASGGGSSELYQDSRTSALPPADGHLPARYEQAFEAPFHGIEEHSGGAWRYLSRIGRLMSETVGGVFATKRPRSDGIEEADAATGSSSSSGGGGAERPALSSPAAPPSTPYYTTAASGYAPAGVSQNGAYGDGAVRRTADTVERRGPRRSELPRDAPPPPPQPRVAPAQEVAPTVRPTPLHPALPVRDTPSYQITINQYFTHPAPDPLPYILPHTAPAADSRRSVEYPSRPSLLKLSTRLPAAAAQRPRVARSEADQPDRPAVKAVKTAESSEASQRSFSNALSAIPAGSPENSLTVPIAPLASARLFNKPVTVTSDTGADAAVKPAQATTGAASFFGDKLAAANAQTTSFLFGAKPASAAVAPAAPPTATATFGDKPFSTAATTVAAAPSFGAPKVNSFVKTGPAAVMPDDDGFAPNADSDDDKADDQKSAAPSTATPAKPTFSFSAAASAPAFGAKPSTTTGAPANPFTFGAKPPAAAPAAPAAPSFGAPKVNSFVKTGPAAVMPDDDGFAPNADSDDDKADDQKSAAPSTATPAKPTFSFSAAASAPAFGVKPSTTTGAPANPFTFGASSAPSPSSATGAAPASPFGFATKPAAPAAPAAPSFGAPKVNSFVKAGPSAVVPNDEGFAPNADSDDDKADDQKRTKTESAAPAKPTFSFSAAASAPAFGVKPSTTTGAPANPFSFSANASAPAFGSGAAQSFSFSNSK